MARSCGMPLQEESLEYGPIKLCLKADCFGPKLANVGGDQMTGRDSKTCLNPRLLR